MLKKKEVRSPSVSAEQSPHFEMEPFLDSGLEPVELELDSESKQNMNTRRGSAPVPTPAPGSTTAGATTGGLPLHRFTNQIDLLENPNLLAATVYREWNRIWNREMATLYLTNQGTTVYKEHLRFVVHLAPSQKLEIPIRKIDHILVFGNIKLTTQVIETCLQEQIPVLFLSSSGEYRGHLWSLNSLHLDSEIVQFKKHQDERFQLETSRAIIRGKLFNPKFSFSQRFRHPPTDPVNALLSFGYTILLNNVLSSIIAEGLSPYFGNLHYGEDRKTYLAFDLTDRLGQNLIESDPTDLVK